MFKGRFFSSRKSGSSSPEGSNSPGSFGSSSSVGSDKKSKSTKDEFAIGLRKIKIQDSSKKKALKSQSVSTWNQSTLKSVQTNSDYLVKSSEFDDVRTHGGESSSSYTDRATVASPILASSLGLNKIKTRSGPLPQESLFTFRSSTGEKGSGVGASNLSKLGEDRTKTADLKKLALQEKLVGCVDRTNTLNTVVVECDTSMDQSTIAQTSSSAQDVESIPEEEKHNMSWHSTSYGRRDSDGCTVQSSYECGSPKESQSPRFQAVIRVTSAPRKRSPNDIKSFSHELNSKGVRPYPFWKPRGLYNIEEVLVSIREKFDKAKEEVNSDLATFAGDLVGILEKNVENHPEWQETIEDLLVLARRCAMMSPGEFWIQCEGIVQDLDDRRQELPMGMLKRLHTQMLFILTRCTRLLQFHKESRLVENNQILLSGKSRHTRSVDKQLPSGKELKVHSAVSLTTTTKKAYSQEQHWIGAPDLHTGNILNKLPDTNISKDLELSSGRDRMSSWKKFPTSKKSAESGLSQMKEQSEVKVQLSKEKGLIGSQVTDVFSSKLTEPLEQKDSMSDVTHVPNHSHKISWGYWGDQPNLSEENSIICRICEEEVPNLRVEEHSRICAIVDRCDHKGVNVDERLSIIAETLEKMIESFSQKEFQYAVGSPDATKVSNSSQTEESDVVSPKLSDQSRRGSEDMFEPDVENSVLMDDMRSFHIFSYKNRLGSKSDQGLGTSSGGSMTPRSPLLTPKASQVDLFSVGKYSEYEDLSQMNELADIARCVAHTPLDDENSLSYLLSCLEALKVVIDRRKHDALTVDTFGARIEKLIQEKYFKLFELVDEEKMDITRSVIDEDTPLEDEIVRSPKQFSIHPKDRTSIEDFEIIKPISRGAFGCVFLARKRTTGDLFAIKVLKKADMIRKNAVESILAERNILISVRNRFVVRFFYSFTCRENLYLVMEYLNGGDLYSLLRNLGCLDENVARVYIAELVLALEYLHSLGVVHRDLKPDNLLIAHDGHIKLADFGLSKVGLINSTDELSAPAVCGASLLGEDEHKQSRYERQRHGVKKRSAAGTPDYLAPEILLGTGHGTSADWWSVGVILFELIVGIPPFNAEHPQIIFDSILNRNIPWPHVPEEMGLEVQDLIERLLTADPQQRLGARGATEVKQHVFFKDINWDTLARQKAAFVPISESALDTSYFTSRYSWNHGENNDESARNEMDDLSDSGRTSGGSSSSCCLSNSPDENGDYECRRGVAHFEAGPCVNYSFSNFSFKNLSQLASINYDLLTKGWKDDI